MKTKKLIDIYKRHGFITIHNAPDDVQWLSDYASIFPLYEHPIFSVESLCATYDINDAQRKKVILKQQIELPPSFDYRDVIPDESICERNALGVFYKNYNVITLRTSQGIEFIDRVYLEPLSDVADELEVYERYTTNGQIYFAVKVGLELKAIILPINNLVDKEFMGKLRELVDLCEMSLLNNQKSTATSVN